MYIIPQRSVYIELIIIMAWLFSSNEISARITRIFTELEVKKINPICLLLDSDILNETDKGKLLTIMSKSLSNHLYYYPELGILEESVKKYITNENKLKEEKDLQIRKDIEIKKVNDRLLSKKDSMAKLAMRTFDICASTDGSVGNKLIMSLLDPSVLSINLRDKLLEHLNQQIIKFLSECKEGEILDTINSLSYNKCMMDNKQNKENEMAILRKNGGVKTRSLILQKLFEKAPVKKSTIIVSRPLVIKDSFKNKMAELHGQKSHVETKRDVIFNPKLIIVKETYMNGNTRLKGSKISTKRVSCWEWYHHDGKLMGHVNYDTGVWSYIKNGATIMGHVNYDTDDTVDSEINEWLNEEI